MKRFTWPQLFLFLLTTLFSLHSALASESPAGSIQVEVGDDGLHKQPWFLESFLDLREDLVEAQASGKRFAVIWEQKGCPYCEQVHTKNFTIESANRYVRENFVMVQLNLWGDREVTDFDGEVLPEKELARKWGVVFTPTIHFFVEAHELQADKAGIKQLASVMPGYFRPFHFVSMFEYVRERRYEKQHFQKYIAEKVQTYRKQGKSIENF